MSSLQASYQIKITIFLKLKMNRSHFFFTEKSLEVYVETSWA